MECGAWTWLVGSIHHQTVRQRAIEPTSEPVNLRHYGDIMAMVTYGNIWSQTISNYIKLSSHRTIITENRRSSQIITDSHHVSPSPWSQSWLWPSEIVNDHQSSSIITNHCKLSKIIQHHHQPFESSKTFLTHHNSSYFIVNRHNSVAFIINMKHQTSSNPNIRNYN